MPPLDSPSRGGGCAPSDIEREEEQVNEVRRELGDRVYGSAVMYGLACAGLVVLLVLRAVLGPI